MRIRQIKPEFWKDPDIAGLAPFTRLTYVGLWLLADDAGWFRADVPAIALELYGWDPRARRERAVAVALAELATSRRVRLQDCGHGLIPTLTEHQRLGGETKRVYTIKREHEGCPRIPAVPRDSPPVPATEKGTGNGTEKGTEQGKRAQARDDESEFRRLVGLPAALGGDR